MYYHPYMCQCPHCTHARMYNYGGAPSYQTQSGHTRQGHMVLKDYGPHPFTINIHEAAKQNKTFRTALWSGPNLQVTLMHIEVGEDIGLELHHDVDQFLRIEQGQGIVQMGKNKELLDYTIAISDDSAIFVPKGTWHNVINTGYTPLKLYAIYAPPNHPFGTVHKTKADAEAAEKKHHS